MVTGCKGLAALRFAELVGEQATPKVLASIDDVRLTGEASNPADLDGELARRRHSWRIECG